MDTPGPEEFAEVESCGGRYKLIKQPDGVAMSINFTGLVQVFCKWVSASMVSVRHLELINVPAKSQHRWFRRFYRRTDLGFTVVSARIVTPTFAQMGSPK